MDSQDERQCPATKDRHSLVYMLHRCHQSAIDVIKQNIGLINVPKEDGDWIMNWDMKSTKMRLFSRRIQFNLLRTWLWWSSFSCISETGNHSTRHNIFSARCTVNQRVCDLIIDGGSVKNIVSKKMVEKLQLKMDKRPYP